MTVGRGGSGSYVQVGAGGGGLDRTIPECPICYASGGGGHGGGCPNMGKPPEEFVGQDSLPPGWWPPPRVVPSGQ